MLFRSHLICPTLRSQAISVFPRRAILSNVSAMRPDTRQGNTVSCFIIPARYKITIALPAAKLCPTDAKKHRAKPISKLYTVLFFGIILCAMRILSFHGVSSRKMRRGRSPQTAATLPVQPDPWETASPGTSWTPDKTQIGRASCRERV